MLYNTQNPHGGDVYENRIILDFSANINPLGTPESVIQAMEKALREVIHYPDPYCRELVNAIAEKEGLPADHILCGNGAAELIYAFSEAVKPSKMLEAAPTFSEYALSVERTGGKVSRCMMKEELDFLPGKDVIESILENRPEVVFICNPNNPTGRLWDRVLLEDVLKVCEEISCRLFVDECFLDLSCPEKTAFDPDIDPESWCSEGKASGQKRLHDSLSDMVPGHKNLFILKAFTKNYGMAGVRLGYCLSSDRELLKAMSETMQPWNVSLIAQKAGITALKENKHILNALEIIKTERKWLTEELIRAGFRVIPSDVNFILFEDRKNREKPLDQILLLRGIAVRNCCNFPGLKDRNWYRIAVRTHEENEQLIIAVKEIDKST